jgi:carboxymethylenebutenolidase
LTHCLYDGKDQSIPLDTLDKMKAALADGCVAAKASEFSCAPKPTVAWFRANGVV